MLVVDDEELAATTLLSIVGRRGWEGRWVSTVQEADGVAADWRPDAVVLDRNLTDGDGIELAKRIRALVPTSRIVMLSGDRPPTIGLDDIDVYLMKPASARAVADALEG